MGQWKPYELHTHTFHSDGKHTLKQMVEKAKEIGLSGIALADHNTMSGLVDKDVVESETDMHIIRGLEWTTFFGHMLTLGISRYVDWRKLTPLDIHKGIAQVHEQGGIVGIAHPYRIGSPICTGCFWEYQINDYNDIDYIEVWSEMFPSIKKSNARAFKLWTEQLNKGYRIAATSGRDWHHSEDGDYPIAVTYLQMDPTEQDQEKAAINALREGKVSISMGPLLQCSIRTGTNEKYSIGDNVPFKGGDDLIELEVGLDFSVRKGNWNIPSQNLHIEINSNKGILTEFKLPSGSGKSNCKLNINGVKWLRAELSGVFHDVNTMIAFTNPIYFDF